MKKVIQYYLMSKSNRDVLLGMMIQCIILVGLCLILEKPIESGHLISNAMILLSIFILIPKKN